MRPASFRLATILFSVALALVVGISASRAFAHSAKKAKSKVPVLGHIWGSAQEGYGQAQPKTIFNGGDFTGRVENIRWKNWGAAKAIGKGTAMYVPPNGNGIGDGIQAQATVVVWNLAKCHGRLAYCNIEWFFPHYGQHFKPKEYIDVCNGTYYPKP